MRTYRGNGMFGIGLPELILILGIALIVVGPEKLPEMAKAIAKVMLDLKKTASSLKESLHEEMKDELGQDPWQQKLGDAYPNLPSTSVPESGTPEIDAVLPSEPPPAVVAAQSEDSKEKPEIDAVSSPDSNPPKAKEEKKQEKPTG
ncbi:MAG: twin-arginine translocase TatA/TatE family subunit [Deltaproteobacteria bacterium]|nr:twin-arginine translocase TatA/TatE family subunit [Deltaproteobacteria bacterium]